MFPDPERARGNTSGIPACADRGATEKPPARRKRFRDVHLAPRDHDPVHVERVAPDRRSSRTSSSTCAGSRSSGSPTLRRWRRYAGTQSPRASRNRIHRILRQHALRRAGIDDVVRRRAGRTVERPGQVALPVAAHHDQGFFAQHAIAPDDAGRAAKPARPPLFSIIP